jgi:transketolase
VRKEAIAALVDLAERDDHVVLLTGDLGFTVLEPFRDRFPRRFYNVGVAEQNMLGIATGLAEAGYTPFAYSIATFASMRGYEFFRDGAVLHGLPVRLIGVGGGFDYGYNGISHFALEDVALMRAQPEVTVLVPADPEQAAAAVASTAALPNPIYLRLGRSQASVPGLRARFAPGHLQTIGSGGDVALVALGPAAADAVEAMTHMAAAGIGATVAVCSSFNPSPADDLAEFLAQFSLVLSIEMHYVNGGLGSFVAETIAERGLNCRLVRLGVDRVPRGIVGSESFLRDTFGLSAEAISRRAQEELAVRVPEALSNA